MNISLFISTDLEEIKSNLPLLPQIRKSSWKVKKGKNDRILPPEDQYEVKYYHVRWLGIQAQIDNERDL